MKLEFSIRNLLLTAALLALAGCAAPPLTPEQKALNKAYDAISSGKAGANIKKGSSDNCVGKR